jgi:hypothetical protein
MVVVPLLNMVLNYPVHDCIGTSLMVDVLACPSSYRLLLSQARQHSSEIRHLDRGECCGGRSTWSYVFRPHP